MGTELFGRKYKLTVAPAAGGEGIAIEDLRIDFSVEKTSTSEPNKATIRVLNLAPHSRRRVEKKNQALVLRAGYTDLIQVVFIGNIKRVEHRREPPDVVTELECKDGGVDLSGDSAATIHKSYAAGTPRLQVIKDILGQMPNTTQGFLQASGITGDIPGKLALSGGCRHVLNRLSGSWGFEWSVLDGALQILNATSARTPQAQAVVLNKETGLLGSPAKTDRGAKFRSFLMPNINPGSLVKLESSFVTGYYKVESVTHAGDSHGGEWITEGEGKTI